MCVGINSATDITDIVITGLVQQLVPTLKGGVNYEGSLLKTNLKAEKCFANFSCIRKNWVRLRFSKRVLCNFAYFVAFDAHLLQTQTFLCKDNTSK